MGNVGGGGGGGGRWWWGSMTFEIGKVFRVDQVLYILLDPFAASNCSDGGIEGRESLASDRREKMSRLSIQ